MSRRKWISVKTGLACMGFGALLAGGALSMPQAGASPGVGCETIHWGFLGSQRRSICDGPKNPDGSWLRGRAVWTPAHYVPGYCYGRYYVSCSSGYYVDETTQAKETYIVFDYNVLPDEPGWLPPGTDVLR